MTESFAIWYKIWLDVAFDSDQKAEARSGIPWDNLTLDFNSWRCIGLSVQSMQFLSTPLWRLSTSTYVLYGTSTDVVVRDRAGEHEKVWMSRSLQSASSWQITSDLIKMLTGSCSWCYQIVAQMHSGVSGIVLHMRRFIEKYRQQKDVSSWIVYDCKRQGLRRIHWMWTHERKLLWVEWAILRVWMGSCCIFNVFFLILSQFALSYKFEGFFSLFQTRLFFVALCSLHSHWCTDSFFARFNQTAVQCGTFFTLPQPQ